MWREHHYVVWLLGWLVLCPAVTLHSSQQQEQQQQQQHRRRRRRHRSRRFIAVVGWPLSDVTTLTLQLRLW